MKLAAEFSTETLQKMERCIQNDERGKPTANIVLSCKVIFKNWRLGKELSGQAKAKGVHQN